MHCFITTREDEQKVYKGCCGGMLHSATPSLIDAPMVCLWRLCHLISIYIAAGECKRPLSSVVRKPRVIALMAKQSIREFMAS